MTIDYCENHNKREVSRVFIYRTCQRPKIKTRYFCEKCRKYIVRITIMSMKEWRSIKEARG